MTGPGTAATTRPRSLARSAVISDPDRVAASTTIVTVASAAMIRLRAGKHQRWPVNPGGISDTTAPASISRACRLRIRAGYAVSAPPASTATGEPAAGGASSAPACAAESMPSAIPETTGRPAAVRPRPSARETSSP